MAAAQFRYIDLFCGIGGFRVAASQAAADHNVDLECVLSSDIDSDAQSIYAKNFGDVPHGDIRKINDVDIPDHELLFAGFPCQPFSIIGDMAGFADDRGTLFFEIKRFLASKRPKAFVLENVKQLLGHDKGRTFEHIRKTLSNELNYWVDAKVLNALDFGLPQKRERIIIVGFEREKVPAINGYSTFDWPLGGMAMKPLAELLESRESVPDQYFASERIQAERAQWHQAESEPTIWHQNKSGNISKLPYSCALRAGASYNYLLVDGVRRLTEREMLRLQGFPETFVHGNYSMTRKQTGNSVPVPLIRAVISRVLDRLTDVAPVYVYPVSDRNGSFVFETGRKFVASN